MPSSEKKPKPTMDPQADPPAISDTAKAPLYPPRSFALNMLTPADSNALDELTNRAAVANAAERDRIMQEQALSRTPAPGVMDWLSSLFTGVGVPTQAGQGTTMDSIRHFMEANPGNSEDAFRAIKNYRTEQDKGKVGYQRDLDLRDAEHALFSQSQIDQKPIMGRLQTAAAVHLYSGVKALAQTYPVTAAPINGLVSTLSGEPTRLDRSSPPDLRELYWGLRPIFGGMR